MTKVTIKTPSDYLQTDWSGGKTKQLFLYPENGDYGERKFSYRLSTATVALRQTTFTLLDGYHRILMSLDKPITLSDLSHAKEISLTPFEPYAFEGDTRIISRGTCQDINLMYDDHYRGQLLPVWSDTPFEAPKADCQLLYALSKLTYSVTNQVNQELEANHLLVIDQEASLSDLKVCSNQTSSVQTPVAVWAGLWHNS
ncbi:HutD/Ves family protein [Streptococcus dysgalactiae]|uniref:HutD/Ves family protein n=1 Tax=Streptococcus dysgalactiae TaxID=1334 RepID=UPI0012B23C5F|nr:HutD family protein [Streptococcus dysgalactiae]MSU86600.1 HutD family protein [Streptococcus dysgalactiae subsp. dysgalactiae]